MTNICVSEGGRIEPCEALKHICGNQTAGFMFQTFRKLGTNECRVAVVVEKSRKNKIEISYCPACGANIETNYSEVNHD